MLRTSRHAGWGGVRMQQKNRHDVLVCAHRSMDLCRTFHYTAYLMQLRHEVKERVTSKHEGDSNYMDTRTVQGNKTGQPGAVL
jgi:hypothetical protein